jgi:hypothetical protein
MSLFPGVPSQADVTNPQTVHGQTLKGKLSRIWQDWFIQIQQALSTSVSPSIGSIAVTGVAVRSVGINAGLFEVGWYIRVVTPASVSSSIYVTVTWVDGGVTCTYTGTAVTGNTTSTTQSQVFVVQADAGTQITYSTTEGHVGTAPSYSVQVFARQL